MIELLTVKSADGRGKQGEKTPTIGVVNNTRLRGFQADNLKDVAVTKAPLEIRACAICTLK
jgi:hypothetical protein